MTQDLFDATLRKFLRSEPFHPFVVELLEGKAIAVERPVLVFNGGAATYFDAEDNIWEFACEDVRAMRPAPVEAAS